MPSACWRRTRRSWMRASNSAFPGLGGCTTSSSRMKPCRRASTRRAARGLAMRYGFHDCQFGRALVMITERGMAGLAFCDPGGEAEALADMQARWPEAVYSEDIAATAPYARRAFDRQKLAAGRTAAGGADRHGFRNSRLGRAARHSARQGDDLFEPCAKHRPARCAARGRQGGRTKSGILRRTVPPGRRQIRRAHRLSLGPDPQAGDAGLGSRARWPEPSRRTNAPCSLPVPPGHPRRPASTRRRGRRAAAQGARFRRARKGRCPW